LKVTGLTFKDQSGIPDAFVGSAYSYQLTPLNNAGTVTWTETNTPPAGMSLSPGGLLSGTPATAGNYNINFSITDGVDTVYKSFGLSVSPVRFTSPGLLPNATQNASYSYTLTASGGTGPYTFALSGGLPNGLSLNSSTGAITGTVNVSQNVFKFSVTVTDSQSHSYNANMAIDVAGTPERMPQLDLYGNSDDCTIGQGCSHGIGVNGGTAPFTFNVAGLPPGMSLSSGNGVIVRWITPGDAEIWGTPTSLGTYNVSVTATDANGLSAALVFPLKISALWLDTGLPNGTVGVAYSAPMRVLGGVPPYSAVQVPTNSVPGSLPAGTSLSGLTVSGTPAEGGNFYPKFLFTDSSSIANTLTFGLGAYFSGAAGTSIIVNTYSTQFVTLNHSWSFQLGACCATGYTWTQIGGTLPHNVALSSGGLLSGTPDTAGTYTFMVQATDAGNAANYGTRQIVVVVTPLSVTTSGSLPYGNVNVVYPSQTLAATGGTGTLTWSLAAGQFLPPGLSLNGATGVIGGTPLNTGQFYFNVNVGDSAGHWAVGYFNMGVYPASGAPPLAINTAANFGTWSIGEIQSQLIASGGTGTYTWSRTAGTLPPGLALRTDTPSWFSSNASAGLMGVATTPGSYSFTLQATSGAQTVSQAFTMKVTGLTVAENSCYRLPDAFVGQSPAYSYNLSALNNAGAVTWTPTSNVPPGITLASNGLLSGTPTQAGYYNFNYNASDGVDTVNFCTALSVSTVQITSPGLLPNPTQNASYSYTVTASGGTAPYTFSVNGLPSGLTINSTTGLISGTVTQGPGRYSFNLTATDHNNVSYTKTMVLVTIGVPQTLPSLFTYGNFDDCTIGMACERPIGANNGGTAPFTWNVTGLPAGMSFRTGSGNMQPGVTPTDVELYGVPLAMGTYNVQATVTDSAGATATETFPLTVGSLFIDGNDYLPGGTRGTAYSKLLRVLGGSGSAAYTAQIARGILPDGVSLSGMTVSGTPLVNGYFDPFFTFTETGSGSTLHITEGFSVGGGTSTINLNTYNFDIPGSITDIVGYYTVGATLSRQLGACCVPSYTWSQTGGTLPAGISLSSSGLLTGTFTTAGTYTFLVQAADSTNSANYGSRQYTIVVTPLGITTSSPLPDGNVNVVYSQSVSSNIAATFSLIPGYNLPPGLVMSAGGAITGTPTASGQYVFYVKAVDASSDVFIAYFSLSIYPNGTYRPLYLPIGPNLGTLNLGQHNYQLTASGGKPPYHYSLTPSAAVVPGYRVQDGPPLGQGFSLTNGTGGFIGILAAPGTWSTSIRVTDANSNTYDAPVTLTATSLDILNPGNPPNATLNSPYSFTFTGYGGTGTYSWSATNLPAGLSINSTTGAISGTPTGSSASPTITITDSSAVSVSRGYTINVDPFAITTGGVLPQGTIGIAYSQTLAAPGCGTGCTWSNPSGLLPNGLSLNSATGAITGTPVILNESTFTVQASGSNGTVQKRFSLFVPSNTPQPLFIGSPGSPTGYTAVGNTYSAPLYAQGGTPPYTFSVSAGTLPPGLSLQTAGETIGSLYNPGYTYLAGRVMQAGSIGGDAFTFTLKVTDAASNTATETYTFIASLMSLNVGTWPIANPTPGTYGTTSSPLIYNTAYTQTQLIQGGYGPYTWSTPSAGNPLPPGLSLNPLTGVVTGTPTNTGSFSTLFEVDDNAGNVLLQYVTFNVAANTAGTVSIGLGPTLGSYQVGGSNIFNINPSGGTGPYTITALTTLPPGCTIEAGSALLSNASGSSDLGCSYFAAGGYTFTLQAQDSVGNVGVKTMNINVVPFTLFSSTSLPNGSVGVPYSEQVLAFDNSAPVTWSVAAGSALPPGMTLAGSTLGGTPTQSGSYSFALTAGDGSVSTVLSGSTVNYTFSLTISTITIATTDIIPAQVITNTPYTFAFTATGGGTKTWSATGLPSGISMSSAGVLSGTTSSTGTYRVTVAVTDGSSTYVHPFTLFARYSDPTLPTISALSTALSDARVGQSVSYSLSPSGGVPPYTWTVASGSSLPPGLSLLAGTSLSAYSSGQTVGVTYLVGIPSTVGSYSFDLIATDSAGTPLRRTYTVNVRPMAIVSGSLTTVTTGVAYAQQLTAVGGTPPYTFTYGQSSLTTDMLPPGFTASASGLISGATTSTGSFGFTATANDSAGHTFTTTYSLTVTNASGLYVSTGPLFGVRLGVGTSITLGTGGGTSTYTWSVSAGALPTGLALVPSGSSTLLWGAPSAPGTYSYTLRATDTANSSNFVDRAYTAVIGPVVAVGYLTTKVALPPTLLGASYSLQLTVAGGTPPYTFASLALSPLPPGLTLSASGLLSGIPTVAGSYAFDYKVTDVSGAWTYVTTLSLNVLAPGANNPLQGSAVNLIQASAGVPYAGELDVYATGGVPPFTWTVASGNSLPPGMSILPGSNGVSSYLGGIPTTAGTYTFALNVADAVGQTGTTLGTLVVSPLSAAPATFVDGLVGTPYSSSYTVSAGTPPYVFSLASGTMPPGLSLSSAGILSGTPTIPGLFTVQVTITDFVGRTLTTSRVVIIDNAAHQAPGLGITPAALQWNYVLTAPAPTLPISVTATSGTLPFNAAVMGIPGATLSATTGTAPAGLTLSLNTAGLTVGTYTGVVGAYSTQAANWYTQAPIVLTVTNPPPCTYSLDSSGVTVPANNAYSNTFNVLTSANCAWTASPSDASWITISGGGPGQGPVSYSLARNTGSSQRTGTINIVANSQTVQSFTITEFGLNCSYGISPGVVNGLSPAATSITVNVTVSASGCPAWTATGLGAPSGTFTGDGNVTLSVPANNNSVTQTSTATIAGQTFTATQNPAACTVTLSSYAVEIPAAGTGASPYTVGVAIPTGCSYSSSASSGVTIQSGGSGSASGTLYYSVAANSTTVSHTLAINIGDKALSIIQDALPCSVTVDASSVSGTLSVSGGGPFAIGVNANGTNCSWTASSPVAWAVVSPTSGSGSGTVNLTLASNAGSATARTTNPPLNIAGNNVAIIQAGTTCTWQLSSLSGTVPYGGGNGAASVVSPGVCGWSGQSNSTWLHVASSGSGGSSDVLFSADPNPVNAPRTGSITIVGASPALTYSVTQGAAPCSYTLGTTSSGLVSNNGYSGAFSFSTTTAGCTPSPQSYAGWLHISGASFSGSSGTLNFTVDPNSNGSTRSGQIKLEDGSTYSVSQSGATCAFSLNAYSSVFNTNGGAGSVQGSPSASGCTPSVGTSQPSIVTIGNLSGPTLNILVPIPKV